MDEPSGNPARTWLIIALGFIVLWIVYLMLLGPRRRAPLEGSAMSEPAAYEWTLFDLEDRPVRFTRFKDKVVFLNIWATWCGPCVEELPSIARLARNPRLQGKNIEFVCVSIDRSSDVVRRFLEGKNWPMTFLRAEELPGVFLTEGIPATFVIAADGRIVGSEVGGLQWDDPQIVSFLEKVASSPPPSPAGKASSPR